MVSKQKNSCSRAFQYTLIFARVNFWKEPCLAEIDKYRFFDFFSNKCLLLKFFGTVQFLKISLKVVSKISHFEIINSFTKICCRKIAKNSFWLFRRYFYVVCKEVISTSVQKALAKNISKELLLFTLNLSSSLWDLCQDVLQICYFPTYKVNSEKLQNLFYPSN